VRRISTLILILLLFWTAQKDLIEEKVILRKSNESWQKGEFQSYERLIFITKQISLKFLVGSRVSSVIISKPLQMLETLSDP
jgi:hypothetical protein